MKTLNSKRTLSQKDVVFSLQRGSILYRVGEYTILGYRFILSNDNVHKIVSARTVHALVNRAACLSGQLLVAGCA